MPIIIADFKVISNNEIAENIFQIEVLSPHIAKIAKPGQFCNIKLSSSITFLRRPLSISDVHSDRIFFIYEVVGKGTEEISKLKKGNLLNIEGPLGNGFVFDSTIKNAVILGGGIGIAPFPFLIKEFEKLKIPFTIYYGARTESKLIELEKPAFIATDDGSEGFHGNIIQLFEKSVKEEFSKMQVFACGPTPMLRAVKTYFENLDIPLQISTESHMACGIGICQGCPIEESNKNGFSLVCKDGPVFNSKEIIL